MMSVPSGISVQDKIWRSCKPMFNEYSGYDAVNQMEFWSSLAREIIVYDKECAAKARHLDTAS